MQKDFTEKSQKLSTSFTHKSQKHHKNYQEGRVKKHITCTESLV